MKMLFRVVSGFLFWLIGMIFIYLGMHQIFDGTKPFVWVSHLGQGLAMVLAGVAIIPNTAVHDFLDRTFRS